MAQLLLKAKICHSEGIWLALSPAQSILGTVGWVFHKSLKASLMSENIMYFLPPQATDYIWNRLQRITCLRGELKSMKIYEYNELIGKSVAQVASYYW